MQSKEVHSGIINPTFLLNAYRHGFFPMADPRTRRIEWYSPDPRAVLEIDEFKISRSLRQTVRKNVFDVRINSAFEAVMRECGKRPETWISEEIVGSYLELHRLGSAHSVESWREGSLEGGLYGVVIGGAFFGESMFSSARDASKVSLVFLVSRLRERGFLLLDTQFLTPHLARFGAKEISRHEYLKRLEKALEFECKFD